MESIKPTGSLSLSLGQDGVQRIFHPSMLVANLICCLDKQTKEDTRPEIIHIFKSYKRSRAAHLQCVAFTVGLDQWTGPLPPL